MSRTKEFDTDQALESALHVFWEKGYEATSIQDLVNATGVNRASLYETFGNKHKLFLHALDRFAAAQNLELATRKAAPGLARIRVALQLAGKQASSDARGCMIVNSIVERATLDPAISDLGRSARTQLEMFFAASLADAERAGEIPKGRDLLALSRFLANSLFGLRVTAKTNPPPELIRTIVETTIAAIENL